MISYAINFFCVYYSFNSLMPLKIYWSIVEIHVYGLNQ